MNNCPETIERRAVLIDFPDRSFNQETAIAPHSANINQQSTSLLRQARVLHIIQLVLICLLLLTAVITIVLEIIW